MTTSLWILAAVLLAASGSMAAFALVWRRGRRDADATRKGSRFLLGIGDFLVHWFMWAIGPAERLLLRLGAGPDHLNASGLVFGLASGVLAAVGRIEAAGWCILAAGVSDVLDGRLARVRGLASPYGKFIDSTLDRFVETFAFLGFAAYLGERPWGALIVSGGLGSSLLVSYAQARGETVGVSGSGGLMQRAERLVLTLLACLFDPALSRGLGHPEGTVLMAVLAGIALAAFGTAVHRTLWIARRLRSR